MENVNVEGSGARLAAGWPVRRSKITRTIKVGIETHKIYQLRQTLKDRFCLLIHAHVQTATADWLRMVHRQSSGHSGGRSSEISWRHTQQMMRNVTWQQSWHHAWH